MMQYKYVVYQGIMRLTIKSRLTERKAELEPVM